MKKFKFNPEPCELTCNVLSTDKIEFANDDATNCLSIDIHDFDDATAGVMIAKADEIRLLNFLIERRRVRLGVSANKQMIAMFEQCLEDDDYNG